MTNPLRQLCRAPAVVALATAVLLVIGPGRIASAHTDFDSSVPAAGAVVEGALSEVVVSFTNPARPAGNGFELLDPDGTVRSPSSIDSTDGRSFVLTFDPSLDAGTYGLRWSVQAGDAHPIKGSFQFEITGDPSPAVAPSSAATRAATPAAAAVSPAMSSEAAAGTEAAGYSAVSGSGESLEGFLDVGTSTDDSAAVGRTGRSISMLGMIFGIGVLSALVWTMRGSKHELISLITWVRLAGLAIFAGGLIEYAALAEADPSASLATLMNTSNGLATALKMAGGLAVLFGFHQRAGRIVAPTQSVSAAVAAYPPSGLGDVRRSAPLPHEHRWTPTSPAAAGMVGYALVLISFWFDGHTVSKGTWPVHSLVNLVHLGAAAAWGGGVFAMTTVAWMRRRRSERVGLAEMVVRFSSVATVSLVAVIGAGLVMTWMVLDAPGDLFSTDWGRILIAKTAVVAAAAALGGYNHFRLRPKLQRRPDDPVLAKELRVTLSIESVAFVMIVVLTAILVASTT